MKMTTAITLIIFGVDAMLSLLRPRRADLRIPISWRWIISSVIVLANISRTQSQFSTQVMTVVVTCPDQGKYLETLNANHNASYELPSVKLQFSENPTTFQPIQGFGYTLTGGSAQHLMQMTSESRHALLQELFGTLQFNTLRLSIGASDLDETPFSYNDVGPDAHFSLERDYQYLIPVLKEIQTIQPNLQLIATPWSAPSWMKDNQSTVGGRLRPEYYEHYAGYLVAYLQAYRNEGLPIYAMSLQNEPLNDTNNPSMTMTADEQATFLRDYLVPALVTAGIAQQQQSGGDDDDTIFTTSTKLFVFEHNPDNIDYPLQILSDPTVYPFVDGTTFHLYAGDIAALSNVHHAFPTKSIHLTEQWTSSEGNLEDDLLWKAQNILIGGLSNYVQTILGWNLSSNPELKPHTEGGCTTCLGAVTISTDSIDGVQRNAAYYLLAHASPYLPPGSIRIESMWEGDPGPVEHVAFVVTPTQWVVLLVNPADYDYSIEFPGETWVTVLGRSLTTVVLNRS